MGEVGGSRVLSDEQVDMLQRVGARDDIPEEAVWGVLDAVLDLADKWHHESQAGS